MLDKTLHSHLDAMEVIEKSILDDIDKIISGIDIDEVISDPSGTMASVVEEIKKRIIEEYAPLAAKQGFDLTELLKKYEDKGKDIIVDPGKDPEKNKEILDVRSQD